MTKNELDKLISININYIYDKIEEVAKKSPFPSIYLNDCNDVLGELYIILCKQRNLDKMITESHLKGLINNILVLMLRKKGSKYVRNIYDARTSGANDTMDDYIYEHNDDEMSIDKQAFDYAVACWNSLGKPSDKILYKLYFIEGFNSVRKLADRLEISNYAAYSLISSMRGTITDICLGLNYAEARENNE